MRGLARGHLRARILRGLPGSRQARQHDDSVEGDHCAGHFLPHRKVQNSLGQEAVLQVLVDDDGVPESTEGRIGQRPDPLDAFRALLRGKGRPLVRNLVAPCRPRGPCRSDAREFQEGNMERFNISLRKYLKEVGVTSQQAIEQVVRDENLAGKGKLKVRMVLTGEGSSLAHVSCPTRKYD